MKKKLLGFDGRAASSSIYSGYFTGVLRFLSTERTLSLRRKQAPFNMFIHVSVTR